jgi:histidine ammonia-lyase
MISKISSDSYSLAKSLSPRTKKGFQEARNRVAYPRGDRSLHGDIETATEAIRAQRTAIV